jgi:hypothetical protein
MYKMKFNRLIKNIGYNNIVEEEDSIPKRYIADDHMIYIVYKKSEYEMNSNDFILLSKKGIYSPIIKSYDVDDLMMFVCNKPTRYIKSTFIKKQDLKIRINRLHESGYSIDGIIEPEIVDDRIVIKPSGFLINQFSILYQKGINSNNSDIDDILIM